MNNLALTIILFLVGMVLTIKGGDFFVDAASWIAERSGIPKLIIGATIVSLATTLPEMLVSVMAAVQGKVDMSIGNAVGSVTANLGLIMALAVIFMPGVIRRKDYLLKSILMLLASAIIVVCGLRGSVSVAMCVVLLVIFAVYLWENVREACHTIRLNGQQPDAEGVAEAAGKKTVLLNVVKFIGGAAAIVVGAQLLVNNGSTLARLAGISERVIGVTLVAIGTSLPELITTITAISLVGLTAMAGAVGSGGLGDFAIRYGHDRGMTDVTWVTVIVVFILVSILQLFGNLVVKKNRH